MRVPLAIGAAVIALGLSSLAPIPPTAEAAPDAAGSTTFQRATGATSVGSWSAYGNVAAGGGGVYHAVSKVRTTGDAVAYLRSGDGGRTWHRAAVFGSAGGGTRPWVAADGRTVAIGYIGAESTASGSVGVPYLVVSTDGGVSWSSPRRIDARSVSGNIQVAVDDDRVWVAWDDQVAGTTDGGATWFAQQGGLGFPYLAAGGGKAVIAFTHWGSDGPEVRAGVIDGASPIDGLDLAPLDGPAQSVTGVAAADGRAFVLVSRGSGPYLYGTRGTDALVGGEVPVAGASQLTAGRGFVAVAGADASGTVRVAVSYDGGSSFSSPTIASRSAVPGSQLTYSLAAAVTDPDEASPRFTWSIPERYRDEDGDGRPDPLNHTGDPASDALRVADARTTHVSLDSCQSRAAGDLPIVNRSWFLDGEPIDEAQDLVSCQGPTIDVESGDSVQVRLEIQDTQGHRSSTTQTVQPRDLVVASLGDSVASGEGSPNQPWTATSPAGWTDRACHSSTWAGPALAARQLEEADPHTSVTFLQLACSGAAVVDTPEVPGQPPSGTDDPKTGGLLDAYQGVDAQSNLRPSQVSQLDALIGGRSVDALTVSVGANDARFSELLESCLINPVPCTGGLAASHFDARVTDLPRRYGLLADALDGIGVAPGAVRITNYFDPTTDEYGVPDLRCALPTTVNGQDETGLISDTESRWAHQHVLPALNSSVAAAAQAHGWKLIGGLDEAFARHGYCSDDPWVVQIGESKLNQGDLTGGFHPNRRGQQAYGDALYGSLRDLVEPAAPNPSDPEEVAGSGALGDLSLLVGDGTKVRSIALTATGGSPTVGRTRVLDQVASGTGFVNPYEPALDSSSSVAMLVEGGTDGSGLVPENVLVQTGLHPNASVADIRLVQAPDDATVLITGRSTLVEATIDATVAEPTTITAAVAVTGFSLHGGERPILASPPEEITVKPGRNRVLLPADQTFEVLEHEAVQARVVITDPAGASPGSDGDNDLTAEETHPDDTVTTRPLRIAFAPLDTGASTPSCNLVDSVLTQQAAYAAQALPVPDDGIEVHLSCNPVAAVDQTKAGVLELADGLDTTARHASMDYVVAVAPDGWLAGAVGDGTNGNVVGVNVNRGIAIDAHSDLSTLAHEIGHGFGLGHTDGEVRASGARVDLRSLREGIDWMVGASADTHRWTGGATWDDLASAIGGPDHAPEPMFETPYGYWVTGIVPPDAPPMIEPLIPDHDEPLDPVTTGGDDVDRLAARPVDGSGHTTGHDIPIGLTGAHTAGADVVLGQSFAQRIVVPAGTTAIRFVLDGNVVETRTIGATPAVTVTAPAAGTQLARGESLDVAWTVDDPDSTDHTVTLLASDDDGATWRPLADHLTGTSATLTVPRDLAGDQVKVRVVASDGSRVGTGDSGTFSVERSGAIEDRLGFISAGPTLRMGTSAPDSTDTRWFSQLPAPFGLGGDQLSQSTPDGVVNWQGFRVGGTTWSPDSSRLYFSANWNAALDAPDPTGGANPTGCTAGAQRLYSVAPDGSDLRVEAGPTAGFPCGTDLGQPARLGNYPSLPMWSCLSFSSDGNRLLWSDVVMDRVGGAWTNPRQVPGLFDRAPATAYPASVGVPEGGVVQTQAYGCPSLSPDGTKVLAAVDLDVYNAQGNGAGNAVDGYATYAVDHADGAHVVAAGDAFSTGNGDLFGPSWSPTGEIISGARAQTCQAVDWWSQHALGGCSQDVLGLDPATGATRTVLGTLSPYATEQAAAFDAGAASDWGRSVDGSVGTGPDGLLYQTTRRPFSLADLFGFASTQYCGWWYQASGADSATFVLPTAYGGATNTWPSYGECRTDVTRGRPETGGSGPGQEPIVPDLTDAPPDSQNEPVTPPDVDLEAPTLPGDPAPGAGPVSPGIAPKALDADVTLDADGRAALTLENDLGAGVRYVIDTSAAGPLTFPGTSPDPDGGVVTPIGGAVTVAATTAFDAPIVVPVRVDGSPQSASLTVRPPAARPAPPTAAPDAITVPVGTSVTVPVAGLLGNDDPSADRHTLLLHAAYDYTGGDVELDRDGIVHVTASGSGQGTFHYLVLEQETGLLAEGTVTVTAEGPDDSTTTTTTASTTTSTPTATSTTTSTPTATSTTTASTTTSTTTSTPTSTTPAGSSTSSTTSGSSVSGGGATPTSVAGAGSGSGTSGGARPGALPRTGAAGVKTMTEAALLAVAVGGAFVLLARRRRRTA